MKSGGSETEGVNNIVDDFKASVQRSVKITLPRYDLIFYLSSTTFMS